MVLSNEYRIVNEENNTILQFYETRVKNKKDGTKEDFVFTQDYYYPNLKTALKAYVNKSISDCTSLKHVLSKLHKLELQLINR
jgi:hypothetical protein